MASNHQLATALILYQLLINYLKLPEGVLSATPQIVYNCLLHYVYTSGIKCLALRLPATCLVYCCRCALIFFYEILVVSK